MPSINLSPWIYQLDPKRDTYSLDRDAETDIAIVGAGIAGVSTAYFILQNTDKKVILLEGNKLAHGATGHNAGHLTSAFELSFAQMVEGFGMKKAAEGQTLVDSAWKLIEEMYQEASLSIAFNLLTGCGGFPTFEYAMEELEDNMIRTQAGLTPDIVQISETAEYISRIPEKYQDFYQIVPQSKINDQLDSYGNEYSALVTYKTGLINSALFCQEIVKFLLNKYSDRFSLFENTYIQKILLHDDFALLDAGKHTVKSARVVLCTNGFENFTIINRSGLDINSRFHHEISGWIGYMCGYLEQVGKPPAVRFYNIPYDLEEYKKFKSGEPYYYITRRPYDLDLIKDQNIVCVGGPEFALGDREQYSREFLYPEDAHKEVDAFINRTLHKNNSQVLDYQFKWHGLMGYTTNRIRMIGVEPKNSVLLYNLGCNGIGILPSIYGGKRISQIVSGEKLEPSIFDPRLQVGS